MEARFSAAEAAVLHTLVADLLELLGGGDEPPAPVTDPLEALFGSRADPGSAPPRRPADPVLARLLPDGYRDDDAAAAELRALTEADLRAGKRSTAQVVRETLDWTGGRIVLDAEAADAWLRALNDMRLAMGTRLGVTEDLDEELRRLPPEHRRAQALSVYGWLGWLQETLVQAVSAL